MIVSGSTVQSEPAAGVSWPSVTVVIPVYNGARDLETCLAALGRQDYPGAVQVVVADNASTDAPSAVVTRFSGTVLVHEPRAGSYAARNTALQASTGEVIAFTDADCQPHPSWIREAVTVLRRPPLAAMVGGRVAMTYRHGVPRTGSELYESVHGFPQDRYLADQHFAVTANLVTWRSVLDEVGHFDAGLRSRGDAQWGQRVHAAGLEQRYAADAVVFHPARATLAESVSKWRRVAQGRVENDLAQGCGPRHFAGLIAHQVRTFALHLISPPERLGPGQPLAQVRYLATSLVCRVTTSMIYARGLSARSTGRWPRAVGA